MTQSIGDFGTEVEEVEPLDLSFRYFGAEIKVNPDFSLAHYIDFLAAAAQLQNIDELDMDPAELVAVKTMLEQLVAPKDFPKFWRLVGKHRQGPEELAKLLVGLVEAVVGRPTERLSSSSDGQPSTGESSEPAVSSQPDRGSRSPAKRPVSKAKTARRQQAVDKLNAEERGDLALGVPGIN